MSIMDRWLQKRESTPVAEPRPALHANASENWGLEEAALAFLRTQLTAETVSAETGAGMSTILFAERGGQHFAITPSASEISAIRATCRERNINDARVEFVVGYSQDVLPQLNLPPLDIVIIDGGHGFPVPFVDWCYLAPRLKVGGLLLVDDIWLWTGTVLVDYLRAEWQWELVQRFGKCAVFRKKDAAVLTDWGAQPFVMARSRVPADWPWTANALRGHSAGLEDTLALMEEQGDANAETIATLQVVERELLDCVRRIEGICARKLAAAPGRRGAGGA